jgi:1-acyl-sn-glycerol-3-phosphate acyltransferase
MSQTTWHYEPAQDIDQPLAKRLARFPREPDMLIYALRTLAALPLRAWLKIYHRLKIQGLENLPQSGSFIMVANHCSHLDALCLLCAIPLRRLHQAFPAAAQDYFFVNVRRRAIAAIFINAMPFARQVHLRQSLDLCRHLLAKPGNILILFPEGTRSTSGEMGEFRPGIGSLVAGSGVPVVPCALKGTFEAWPKGQTIPRPRPVRLVIGEPQCFTNCEPCRESFHQIAQSLETSVRKLLCQ